MSTAPSCCSRAAPPTNTTSWAACSAPTARSTVSLHTMSRRSRTGMPRRRGSTAVRSAPSSGTRAIRWLSGQIRYQAGDACCAATLRGRARQGERHRRAVRLHRARRALQGDGRRRGARRGETADEHRVVLPDRGAERDHRGSGVGDPVSNPVIAPRSRVSAHPTRQRRARFGAASASRARSPAIPGCRRPAAGGATTPLPSERPRTGSRRCRR